jgi:phage-related tail protein
VDALPFVDLPKPESERMQTVADLASEIASTVKDLNARITEVRSNAAGAIGKVTDALGNAKDRLTKIATELDTLDTQMLAVQARAAQLKQTIPVAITVAMILITLLALWVAYTQIVVMRGAWRKLRAPAASADAALPSGDVSG